MGTEINSNLLWSIVFDASDFQKEGFSLNLLCVLTLTVEGNGMTSLIGELEKALWNDLLGSILLLGSVRELILYL
jgi:hypothetical protein